MILLATLLALQGQYLFSESVLPDATGKPGNLLIAQPKEKRNGGPKLSPRAFGTPARRYEFDWVTAAYVENPLEPANRELRFRVYSQERKEKDDVAWNVTRMLLRCWNILRHEYGMDHNGLYNGGLVDVYICNDGKPGGEQRFDVDDQQEPPAKVNTIYIFDVESFADPVEMAREVAHEYGHAVLSPVGGFKYPEDWANGYLGEKVFLRRFAQEIEAKRLAPADAMNAELPKLKSWVAKNVDRLADTAAHSGPRMDLVKTSGKAAMDSYLGVALWLEETCGPKVFKRAGTLNAQADVKGYLESVLLAVEEPDRIDVAVPNRLGGKPVFLPVGKANIEGGKVLSRRNGWAKVQPTSDKLTIVNR